MTKPSIVTWLALVALSVAMPMLVYVSTQQSLRLGANDPQIQLAEDAAAQLAAGKESTSLIPTTTVDIDRSLAPFMIIYNSDGSLAASSAQLNGHNPVLPDGVLNDVATNNQQIAVMGKSQPGELRFTW